MAHKLFSCPTSTRSPNTSRSKVTLPQHGYTSIAVSGAHKYALATGHTKGLFRVVLLFLVQMAADDIAF